MDELIDSMDLSSAQQWVLKSQIVVSGIVHQSLFESLMNAVQLLTFLKLHVLMTCLRNCSGTFWTIRKYYLISHQRQLSSPFFLERHPSFHIKFFEPFAHNFYLFCLTEMTMMKEAQKRWSPNTCSTLTYRDCIRWVSQWQTSSDSLL